MNFTQDFFTSRRNFGDSTTYVGQTDRLWYDPVTNTIRIGDGSPGGKLVHDGIGTSSPLTTKGDIYTFDTDNVALPVGTTDGLVLTVDSGTATGLAWLAPTGGGPLATPNIDGGNSVTVYLITQNIEGGGSNTVYSPADAIDGGTA